MKKTLGSLTDLQVTEIYAEHDHNAASASIYIGCASSTLKERISLIRAKVERAAKGEAISENGQDVTDEAIRLSWGDLGSTSKVAAAVGLSSRTIRERLAKMRTEGSLGAVTTPNFDVAGGFERLASSVPVDGPGGSKLKEISVGFWQQGGKDGFTQDLVKQNLDKVTAKYAMAASKSGFEPLVSIPRECPVVAYEPSGIKDTKTERVFIVGDQQMGFWAVLDPKNSKQFNFVPFHDEHAQSIMLQAMSLYLPDRVVIIGDFVDFPSLSKFQQEPEFQATMQATVDDAEALIAKIRKTVGSACKIDFILGNHETRMQRTITDKVPSLHNLTIPGEKYAMYSVPSLLRFERHDVEPSAEYPSGKVVLAKATGSLPALIATHANVAKKDMRSDSIHGHLVLPGIETFARPYEEEEGTVWKTYTRMCVSGCSNYSDTGDKVRLTRTSTPSGRSNMAAVQSFGTVDIDKKTGQRAYGLHLIRNDSVSFLGKIISSDLGKRSLKKRA